MPVLDQLAVCAASRDEVIDSAKKTIRSYLRRATADGTAIPPESDEEVLEIEVDVSARDSSDPAADHNAYTGTNQLAA